MDVYTYYGMNSVFLQSRFYKVFKLIYLGVSVFTMYAVFHLSTQTIFSLQSPKSAWTNFMFGFVLTVLVTKVFFSVFMILQDGGRLLISGFNYLHLLIQGEKSDTNSVFIPERRQFINTVGTFAAGIPFFSMLYGITKGKYQYTIQKISLSFEDLPPAFDGFRMVQISDIHAGSFDSKSKVEKGIDMINDLNADVVCFTGDLVNVEKDEIDPYIDIFAKINAKYGKFATLGNHDYYGSYDRSDDASKNLYFNDFFKKYTSMGFDLLNNTHRNIKIGQDSINIIGVENWGAGRWFPKKGDLQRACESLQDKGFNVLLSHDPTHWEEKVLSFEKHIHLTLSGHTHGFQFGFQMPGFQWSPAQYRYKRWLGLYKEADKYLYINRGFGFLGFPGRIGMWPEITVIELKVKNPSQLL